MMHKFFFYGWNVARLQFNTIPCNHMTESHEPWLFSVIFSLWKFLEENGVCSGLVTFLFILLLLHDVFPLTLLTGRGDAEWAFADERGASGIKRCCDAALLLPPLLSLQTRSKCTSYCVTQTLTLPWTKLWMSKMSHQITVPVSIGFYYFIKEQETAQPG